jgi:hypothetical protein
MTRIMPKITARPRLISTRLATALAICSTRMAA